MAKREPDDGLTTLVCVTCGAELYVEDGTPDRPVCPKCKSTVFRAFTTPTRADEVTVSRLEEEARSIEYGDPSPQTSMDEVRDLDT